MEKDNLKTAFQLLEWNKTHLLKSAEFKKEDLAEFYAPEFLITVNDRRYDGTYDAYFEFLDEFRQNITSLSYEIEDFIDAKEKVVIPLRAKIEFTDGKVQVFDAILILGFNDSGKIILWHEVYVEEGSG